MMLDGLTTDTVLPVIKTGSGFAMEISGDLYDLVMRAVVDSHVHLPDMFEITFLDREDQVADKFKIGTTVEVWGSKSADDPSTKLITGEVTSIEGVCAEGVIYTVVRGYEKAHRLQRAKRTRTFVNKTDSDIAKEVAGAAGLSMGTVDSTQVVHDHLAQVAQTDWEFLTQRAREIGYETGVTEGEFFFRKASGSSDGGGGLGGALGAAAGALGLGGGGTLDFQTNLITFLPRISAANITPKVEVRVWDPKSAKVQVGSADAASGTATIDGQDPKKLAQSFAGNFPALPSPPALPPIPGLPAIDFGLAPDNSAYVVVDRPLAIGSAAKNAADEAAKGVADHIASTFAEAEGYAFGDPAIKPGASVTVASVPKAFAGSWVVTNAVHIFEPAEGGYRTRFYVSGRQDRSLLALASGAGTRERKPTLNGLVCGVVTNTKDPDTKGKVKVALPWLAPNYESDWARVVQVGAGRRSGLAYVPEVGDEVLIGFEFGDPRRPYVLGGLVNDNTDYDLMKNAVNGSGTVVKRGIMTPAGNGLVFSDELPPGPPGSAPPTTSMIELGTKDSNLSLAIDQANGKVTLTCKPAPPSSKTPTGTLTIECGDMGTVNIITGNGGTMKISSGGQLEISGKLGVKISSDAMVEVSGKMIKLN